MANPRSKMSKTRRDKRRTHYKATAPTLTKCSNCGATIQMHHVCPECGYYRGQLAIATETAAAE
ncbi:MAG: 50S ribosomal protein L32 [Bacteroidales bacterium]|jgi:large subunit ribosomal protein L32|nr:50S ribosomal protein L32 [Bacteroidales bacterium]MBO7461479.1 50S ribosomal protein L32 [Bacteroidales bacterium]MBO7568367.1 50S ribosomal protein L32 [Bacteroidales bacterium]MBQ4408399.1 50S ribosomal protein L32 [Bacteroidales bacterium]MBQ5512177.1 50S ribosomal protein L32 [Bacteroidales bacterium]